MILGIEFRDEHDKRELVELAQNAKEAACDLWEKLAEHMPELHEIQERNGRYRGGYGMNGWGGNVGYRNYGGGSNYRGGYDMSGGSYRGGYDMGGYYREGNEPFGHFRENPNYTGGNDRRGY